MSKAWMKQMGCLFFYTFLKDVQIIKGQERLPAQEKPGEAESAVAAEDASPHPQASEGPAPLPRPQQTDSYGGPS
jgi:hypothetical protein